MLKNAKWIWNTTEYKNDEYVDFISEFNVEEVTGVKIDISVDGMFGIYVNGALAGFGECSDDENNKLYDTFCLDKYLIVGKNQVLITVWHHGSASSNYKRAKAGCIFSIEQAGKELVNSSEETLSRINLNFKNGYCKYITGQLGLSFYYNNSIENTLEYTKSVVIDKSKNITFREIENLILQDRIDNEVTVQGDLVTIDMKKETAGFLELDFFSEEEQEILITYGEHLDENGLVTRRMSIRDFSVEFYAKKGENKFLNPLRRLAGRYIQFTVKHPVKISYVALRPVVYPVKVKQRKFENKLHQRIYDTSIHTLICCMHAHYEDCPWREQALYALDSRNQMLCGYVAFNEYRYARHNLILLSRAYLKDEKLLNLTYPRDSRLPIPFFSLVYVLQVAEYVEYSGDLSIIEEVKDVLDGIMNGFNEKVENDGLIPNFPFPCWNFYEWMDGNSHALEIGRRATDKYEKSYDVILNAMYVYVSRYYDKLTGNVTPVEKTVLAIKDKFYDQSRGLFISSDVDGKFSVLANTLAILCGAGGKEIAQKIIEERQSLVDVSLSMYGFFYQALLNADTSFKEYILRDIEEKYGYMLEKGATSFWETILGAEDFEGAGSLCHGWSALPLYWLDKLVK